MEVEERAEQTFVIGDGIDHLNCECAFLDPISRELVCLDLGKVDMVLKLEIDCLVLLDLRGFLINGVCEIFEGRRAIADIELDTEITMVFATGVMGGSEDDATDTVAYFGVEFADVG